MHASFEDHMRKYLVLDYCAGGDLCQPLTQGNAIRPKCIKFYASCLLLALEHLHDKHIIFKDLKSENVIIDSNGFPKLVDFGNSFYKKTKTDFKSDPFYFKDTTQQIKAPEVLISKDYDAASDWWAFGCLLYELAFIHMPFSDDNPS